MQISQRALAGYILGMVVLYGLSRGTQFAVFFLMALLVPATLRLNRRHPSLESSLSAQAAGWMMAVALVMSADVIGLFSSLFRSPPTPTEIRIKEKRSKKNNAMVRLENASQSRDPAELKGALGAFDELIALGVPREEILGFKARALIGLKRFDEGKTLYREWLEQNPGPKPMSEFAKALYNSGQYEDALKVFEEALAKGQGCDDLGGAGLCAMALGKRELAESYGQQCSACQGAGLAQQLGWALAKRPDFFVESIQASGVPFDRQTPYQIELSNGGGAGDENVKTVQLEVRSRGKTLIRKDVAVDAEVVKVKLPESVVGEVSVVIDPEDRIWEGREDNNELLSEI